MAHSLTKMSYGSYREVLGLGMCLRGEENTCRNRARAILAEQGHHGIAPGPCCSCPGQRKKPEGHSARNRGISCVRCAHTRDASMRRNAPWHGVTVRGSMPRHGGETVRRRGISLHAWKGCKVQHTTALRLTRMVRNNNRRANPVGTPVEAQTPQEAPAPQNSHNATASVSSPPQSRPTATGGALTLPQPP